MFNKRGQELSVGTIILIVLGIIILVLLILGFSLGWQNLFEKINIFGGGASLESVVQRCNLAVTSSSTAGFCSTFDYVKIDGKKRYANCDYSKVRDNLQGSVLECSNGAKIVEDKCKELIVGKFKKSKYSGENFAKSFNTDCKASGFLVNDGNCDSVCDGITSEEQLS